MVIVVGTTITPHYVKVKPKIKFILLYFSSLDNVYPSEDSRVVREYTLNIIVDKK